MTVYNPFDFFVEEYAETLSRSTIPRICETDLAAYLEPEPAGPLLRAFLNGSPHAAHAAPSISSSISTAACSSEIRYIIRMEPACRRRRRHSSCGSGSCRDSRWLLVQILRHLGLAARFVSGYLIQLKPDLDGARRAARHRARLHRSARLGRGLSARRRLDRLDPTSGLLAGEGHIPLAATPHYRNAAPISGAVELRQCRVRLRHERSTASPSIRASPSRSPTKPGQALDALGERSTRELAPTTCG